MPKKQVKKFSDADRKLAHDILEAMRHPNVPQEFRDEYAEPLLRIKLYGHHELGPGKDKKDE